MASALKIIGGVVLFVIIMAALAITVVPRFLDRIYYRGAQSGHFDTTRFFNPDGDDDTIRPPGRGGRAGFFWRYLTGNDDRPAWPASVAITPRQPPARVEGERLVVTWVGHASVLLQTQGLNILTDPVWSERAGPLGFGPKRVTAPGIAFDQLPRIDLVVVSHNHYDHLDQATLRRIWERDRPRVVTSFGNDSVIGQVGVPATALDWGQRLRLRPGVDVIVTRNHHWSSRWFTDRNRALWSSFVIRLPSGGNIFFAGDTGMGDGQWPAAAAAYGPVRFAMLPIGAFRFAPGQMASGSHIGPLDAVRVFARLGTAYAMPIHWGTFRLSYEKRDTPPRMLTDLMTCSGADPARFAPAAIGVPFMVPPYARTGRQPDEGRLGACARSPEIRALR